jgi:GntR family transcriptional repressor for pyruvate dehydrogenase complex
MVFKPVARSISLVDTVVDQVQRLIADGHLGAGERLPKESELVEKLAVSRTVLREALSRLEATGLVTIQRGRGMFVADPGGVTACAKFIRNALVLTSKDLEQYVEFRRVIECQSARLAAERARPEDLAELERLCQDMNREDLDYTESVRIDFQFHLKIVELGGNSLMHAAMEVIAEFIMAAMLKTTPNPRDYDFSRSFHLKLVDAIRSGDPNLADQEARAHMDRSAADLRRRST